MRSPGPRSTGPGHAALALALAVCLLLAGCGDDEPGTVRVAAAASLREVVDGLRGVLDSGDEPLVVEADLGGSSTLAQQLLDGLPADVFLSADEETMRTVVRGGLADGAPVTFATNHLVLAVPDGNPAGISSLDDFGRQDLLVGRCAPQVPCGRLALAELRDAQIADAADTEEPDVRSLLAKVRAGELDVALVYATDVVAAGQGVDEIDDDRLDERSRYQAVRIRDGDREASDRFLAALRGPTGSTLLTALGFGTP